MSSRTYTDAEKDFIRQHFATMTRSEIASALGRSENAIHSVAGRLSLLKKLPWQEAELDFLRQHYQNMKAREVAHALGRSTAAVKLKARAIGLESSYFHHINHNFFSVPNPINSYYAGFIAADGCITRNTVTITINRKDQCILEALCRHADADYPIHAYPARPEVILSISSHQWLTDLRANFNITPRKSLTLQPPPLEGDLALAFICGYIDGDGHIGYHGGALTLMITGTSAMLSWIKNNFAPLIPTSKTNLTSVNNVYRYKLSYRQARTVLQHLNSLPLPFRLPRKWNHVS